MPRRCLIRSAYLGVAAPLAIAFIIPVCRADAGDNWTPAVLATQNEAGMASSQIPDADLQNAFLRALKSVEELRKKNRSTAVECTKLFAEFNRYSQTTPYISFFDSKGISAITVDMNQRHYVYWQIDRMRLQSLGYRGFLRNDRLVIGFTTMSALSTEITSFEVTLLNSDHL